MSIRPILFSVGLRKNIFAKNREIAHLRPLSNFAQLHVTQERGAITHPDIVWLERTKTLTDLEILGKKVQTQKGFKLGILLPAEISASKMQAQSKKVYLTINPF